MKLSYIILIIATIIFPTFGDLEEEFLKYEQQNKTIALSINKIENRKKKQPLIKLKKDHYFELVPPEYELKFDTVMVFDTNKFYPEMEIMYNLNEEQYLLKKGGYKWINEKQEINLCNEKDQYRKLEKNQKLLKFVKEHTQYGKRKVLTLKHFSSHSKDSEERSKRLKRAFESAKNNRVQQIRKYEIIKRNGYLKKVSINEFRMQHEVNKKIIKLKKGCYNISKKISLESNCEPNLTNIQSALKRLGYETNTNGEETMKYRWAKSLFIYENKLNNNEDHFLKQLGF